MTLSMENLSLQRGQRKVLAAVNLQLQAGELLMLVGPNGAGKSSLLHAAAGDFSPSSGRITLDGKPLSHWPLAALAKRRAVLAQSDALAFAFTVEEVVALGRQPHGDARLSCGREAIAAAMSAMDVTRFRQRIYTELSGGERARVRLARALAQVIGGQCKDNLLLLDEPLAAVDLHYQHTLLARLKDYVAQGLGIMLVIHDLQLAARYADRVGLLDNAQLAALGRPAQVLTEARLSQVYQLPMRVLQLPELDYPLVISGTGANSLDSAA